MKKAGLIIFYSIFTILILYVVEQVLQLPFMIKTIIKLPMFTLLPGWMLTHVYGKKIGFVWPKKHLHFMVIGMTTVVVSILSGYYIVESLVDVEVISMDITNRMQIGTGTMVLAALYTTLVNSLIEEYFFRGFLFLGLRHSGHRRLAYVVSAVLFALYHVTIFLNWFTWPVMLLALLGLVAGGLIFGWFADKTDSLIGSWLIHISADIALIAIGFFGLNLMGY